MWATLVARSSPVTAESSKDPDDGQTTTRQHWDGGNKDQWDRTKSQMDEPGRDEPGQTTAWFPRVDAAAMHDLHPGEERAMPAAIRSFPRLRLKGDQARRSEQRVSWQGTSPDWAPDDPEQRGLRDRVTNVQAPNSAGFNADWAAVVEDPADQYLRNPASGDWWLQ